MTDEEKAREIAAQAERADCGKPGEEHERGTTHCDGCLAESITAALREARVEGARKGIEAAAKVCLDRALDETRWVPSRAASAACEEFIRALDPAEVVR